MVTVFSKVLNAIAKSLKYLASNNPFVLIWILNFIICEIIITDYYLFHCTFPQISQSSQINIILIADPQLTDQYSYKQHGLLLKLTEFYSDIYMKRNFKKIITRLDPEVIIFVGDLMDGGREWEQDQFNEELQRFKKIFTYNYDRIISLGVAGNHDIGFGKAIVKSAHERYIKTFGDVNSVSCIGDHCFFAIDTIALSGNHKDQSFIKAQKFLDDLLDFKHDFTKRILLTHVPLYRPENAECGSRRVFPPITNRAGYQYQSNST
jgi:calcineurin-like phosphoesterase family protein